MLITSGSGPLADRFECRCTWSTLSLGRRAPLLVGLVPPRWGANRALFRGGVQAVPFGGEVQERFGPRLVVRRRRRHGSWRILGLSACVELIEEVCGPAYAFRCVRRDGHGDGDSGTVRGDPSRREVDGGFRSLLHDREGDVAFGVERDD